MATLSLYFPVSLVFFLDRHMISYNNTVSSLSSSLLVGCSPIARDKFSFKCYPTQTFVVGNLGYGILCIDTHAGE